jgi:BASS family bile acid:Na+ symporter
MDFATLLPLAIKSSIVLMVLAIGMNATWQDATYLFRQPGLLLRSVVSMNVIMPLAAAGFVLAFDLPLAVRVALVALAVSPVPPILPRKEQQAGGNRSYAVGLLVAIGVLAIVTVPLAVTAFTAAFDRDGEIAPWVVAKVVFTSILAPLAAGMALLRWAPALAHRLARPVGLVGYILLIACAVPLVVVAWPELRGLIGSGAIFAFVTLAVVGLAVGHVLGGPEADHRTVLALSTASRHPAIALAIAAGVGLHAKAGLAAIVLYLLVALVVCLPYVHWRRRLKNARQPSAPEATKPS